MTVELVRTNDWRIGRVFHRFDWDGMQYVMFSCSPTNHPLNLITRPEEDTYKVPKEDVELSMNIEIHSKVKLYYFLGMTREEIASILSNAAEEVRSGKMSCKIEGGHNKYEQEDAKQ